MTIDAHLRPERRRSGRISPKGTVILLAGKHAQRGRIANLSTGGVLATTEGTAAQDVLGLPADIELRLDSQHDEWVRLSGRVVRIAASTIAVELTTVTPAFLDLLDTMSTASHGHRRVLSVVLVDATTERRERMAEAFRASGCTVVDVASVLEAIVRLGESQFEPDLIAIANSVPSSTSDELRRFVERDHPRATMVTIGDDLVEPAGLLHWLSAADPGDDLAARVRQVLIDPRR